MKWAVARRISSLGGDLLHLPPLAGGIAAGESEGGAGGPEPTHGAAGEQLQGLGTLPRPVWEETPGQPPFLLLSSKRTLKKNPSGVRNVVFEECSAKPATELRNLYTRADSQEIESHYAAGSEAKFNLWLTGMHIGYIHPCLKSSIMCRDEVQQGVESMR